jgi:hypothetical protein
MISKELRDARQQEGFAASDHECHHTQLNGFVHNSVPIA